MKLSLTVSCLLAVAVSIKADGWGGDVYAPGHASVDYYAYPKYAFEYSVKDPHTGDNKAQWEKRDGDVVKGAYSLVEPDGSLRVVEYWADDKSGFNAVVKRIGPNLHPTGVHVEPIYKAPIPTLGHGPIGPISVGPVAKYEGLAHAPYITGPIHGGAISTASLIKEEVPIIKPLLLKEPLLIKEPLWKEPIIAKEPVWREPYLAKEPLWQEPLYGKEPLLLNKPLLWNQPIPLLKESIVPVSPWSKGLIEGIGHGHGYGGYEGRGEYGGKSEYGGYGGRNEYGGYGGRSEYGGYGGRSEYGGYGGRDGYGWGAPRWGGPKH